MNYRSGVITGIAAALLVVGASFGIVWILFGSPIEALKSPPPKTEATVPSPAKEDQFNTVLLGPTAERVLNITTATATVQKLPRSRFYGGDVMIPNGRAIIVSAPVSGLVKATDKPIPKSGETVESGQPVLQLLPLLTPEGRASLAQARVDAEGVEQKAKIDVDGAKLALDRAQMLLADKTGSQRMVDEAKVMHDGLLKIHEAAQERVKLLVKVTGEANSGTTTPIPLTSPSKGFLRNLSVVAGQLVPAGAVLFEVVDTSKVWIRVPVYVGDLPDLDRAKPSQIGNLSKRQKDPPLTAVPVVAPPSANPLAGTVDVYYELANSPQYSPGHRVGVTIPIKGETESLTVPLGAVIHDIHGGTWVYEKTAERTYVRRRIVVQYVVDDKTAVLLEGQSRDFGKDSADAKKELAKLPEGLKPGAVVVVGGSAELFGTETGYSK
jgi:cobalt-zinc-cadmium efflux system membrane fusion protein